MNLLPGIADIDAQVSSEKPPKPRFETKLHQESSLGEHHHSSSNPTKATSSTSRVYKATTSVGTERQVHHFQATNKTSQSVGTRRRRRQQSTNGGPDASTGYMVEAESDSSIGHVDELPAPPLWGDDGDDYPRISPSGGHKQPQSLQIRLGGSEDISENTQFEDELFSAYETHLHTHVHTHDHTNRCCPPHGNNNKKRGNARWWSFNHPYANVMQCAALLFLAFLVYDSHHRVHKHKIQLQEYDEERAHILEQMMWIDQAAKKGASQIRVPEQWWAAMFCPKKIKGGDESARAALEKLQVRIQLNARDRLAQKFGDKPAEISLKLNDRGEHLIVALSDDTPHAVSILLEQVEHRLWDTIRVEKASTVGAVQIASTKAATTPLLEFVEPSRGCHEVGLRGHWPARRRRTTRPQAPCQSHRQLSHVSRRSLHWKGSQQPGNAPGDGN